MKNAFIDRVNFIFFIVAASFIFIGCNNNAFDGLSSKTTDDALLEDARKAVNQQEYQVAIDIITTQLTASAQAQTEAKQILANGYAGKCGLNFVTFVSGLSTATSGSAFRLLSSPFVGQAVDPASCYTSLQVMDSIGSTAQRTADQNAFTSVVGMTLIGSAIRLYTDAAPTSSHGDGTEDVANSSCALTNQQIDYVILGFGYMANNFSYLSNQLGSTSQGTISGVVSVCNGIPGVSCIVTDPTQISTLLRDTMKDLLNTTDYGVGTVTTGGNAVTLVGACP